MTFFCKHPDTERRELDRERVLELAVVLKGTHVWREKLMG